MQIVSSGDNLHEISNLISGRNKKHVPNLSSAGNAQRVVKVKKRMDFSQILRTHVHQR